jgi:hypothetical protein
VKVRGDVLRCFAHVIVGNSTKSYLSLRTSAPEQKVSSLSYCFISSVQFGPSERQNKACNKLLHLRSHDWSLEKIVTCYKKSEFGSIKSLCVNTFFNSLFSLNVLKNMTIWGEACGYVLGEKACHHG